MLTLLIAEGDPHPPKPTAKHRFGGLPIIPNGTALDWPTCRTCNDPMQFLGQLHLPDAPAIALLFMCHNYPGLCDEWDANAGGNRAVIVGDGGIQPLHPPDHDQVTREVEYAAIEVQSAAPDYNAAREAWASENGGRRSNVLGQLGGAPAWIQADETPTCDACGQPMRFVAQLEEGPHRRTAMNFGGGGCGYLFVCMCGPATARFLWQR